MPRGDDKHKLIFEGLINILGEEFVEDDPAVIEAISGGDIASLKQALHAADVHSSGTIRHPGGPQPRGREF